MTRDLNLQHTPPCAHWTEGSTSPVLAGNASRDGADHRGWFIGHYIEQALALRCTHAVEVKWSALQAGEEKPVWATSEKATTLCILIKGRFCLRFPSQECTLTQEGDYVMWPPGLPHRWVVEEDALILTLRWPSLPA